MKRRYVALLLVAPFILAAAAKITNSNIASNAAIAFSKMAALNNNVVPVTNGSGVIGSSAVSATTLGYLDATSSIQTQIDGKLATGGNAATATALAADPSACGAGDFVTDIAADGTLTCDTPASGSSQDSPYEITNCIITTSVSSNALTIALKGNDGNDPSGSNICKASFRSSTLTSGAYVQRSVTSAVSLTISSGSTLGFGDGAEGHIFVYLVDDGGTVVLGAVGKGSLGEMDVHSSTAEGGAGGADTAGLLYTASAVTSKAIRKIGVIRITEATAGTWASNATAISGHPMAGKYCELVGTARWPGIASCTWGITSDSGTYVSFPVDSDCNSPQLTGALQDPGSKIPGFRIYDKVGWVNKINVHGLGLCAANGSFRITNGTNTSAPVTTSNVTTVSDFTVTVAPSAEGQNTYQLQGSIIGSSSTCDIQVNNALGRDLYMTVERCLK